VYINGDLESPYVELFFSGTGQDPRLLFDRQYVILPIVPLGFTAESCFWVFNDGYDNLIFEDNDIFFADNIDELPVKLSFPAKKKGYANRLGVTKRKM
jgi:hypothetical protein